MIGSAYESHALAKREKQFIVGRESEINQFRQLLTVPAGDCPRILHIYGTGGVGKSTFLQVCRDVAAEEKALFYLMDSRDYVHTEEGFCRALLTLLTQQPVCPLPSGMWGNARESCLISLRQLAEKNRVVIALDTFEEMMDLEAWLRDRFIPWLPPEAAVLSAGRHPLKGGWMLSAAWREVIRQLQLPSLRRGESGSYAQLCGIHDEQEIEWLWKRARGHPLTLSMAIAAEWHRQHAAGSAWGAGLEDIASLWLKEVPDEELRAVVEAASVLRCFDQELLSFVMEKELAWQTFERLKALSFVRQSVNGWQLHDLVSEIIGSLLKERAPRQYYRYKERSAYYYAQAVISSSRYRSVSWEIEELFRNAGVKVLRALGNGSGLGGLYWEAVTESTLDDAAAYVDWRNHSGKGIAGWETDPDTGEKFLIEYSTEALRQGVGSFNIREMARLEPEAVKLLRRRDGSVEALSVIIPIHRGTLSWLKRDPICRPYIDSLQGEERDILDAPAERPVGWFLRIMDFRNLLDPGSRTQGLHLIYAHMCKGGLFVCSPYTTEISRKVYPAMGFRQIEGATHRNFDGKTETYTYAIDTRGAKLREFIGSLFLKAGMEWKDGETENQPGKDAGRKPPLLKRFTEREREVIEYVMSGCSNAEVASKLFVSEVTVKKHLKSIYTKLGVSTRTQLVRTLLSDS